MNHKSLVRWGALAVMLLALAGCQPVVMPVAAHETHEATAASEDGAGTVLPTDPVDVQIANAMSAAPIAIAQDATIIGFPAEEGGEMRGLREGTNAWTCFPDWPATPTNDPMCLDPVWQAWFAAYAAGTEPEIPTLGIAYMLQGATNASNTDPFALEPPPGEEWITSPPHIMLLVPGGFDPADFTTDHHSGGPYIMWEGTPYEHLMVPIQVGPSE